MTRRDQRACLCGCGALPKSPNSNYVPGHDLAHAQRLVTEALAGGDIDALRLELPTDQLRGKFDQLLEQRS